MPHTGDTVLVTAARDGQIRCHVMSTSGNLMTSKRVSHHRDSAHKVGMNANDVLICLVHVPSSPTHLLLNLPPLPLANLSHPLLKLPPHPLLRVNLPPLPLANLSLISLLS